MESDENMEIIQKAIRKLMEEEEIKAQTLTSQDSLAAVDEGENPGGGRQRQLLSNLLSQLESLDEDKIASKVVSKLEADAEDTSISSQIDENSKTPTEEIIKELKNVKRQNSITHGLLTGMIVITLVWQLSEVSLILKIKDGLSNPFKSIGGMIKGFLKRSPQVDAQNAIKQVIEPTSLPGLKVPEPPFLELPGFDSGEE